ncbi:metalloprotease PmbA [Rhodocyclus tenuis]|uniref:Metalloprotease PmbA n=2 Tax=Rhodocyclus TaxID=1064 RepID=A0A6L5JTI8_RHOTE|nr:metalloprotease PmbA [Rhodocyclus gracilis]MQY50715.1 metalloprotease PmbA [Rhodocyclus gracilis]MRD72718.1 metalloprotease PmbA [Rhodocyclus gracilis]NJA88245.1 metalloprotease PmbA [Rhodocyclus gracilis]
MPRSPKPSAAASPAPSAAPAHFAHGFATLQQLAADALAHARAKGASACEVEVSEGFGQSATVRCGDVETIEYNRDKGVGVTVFVGQRKGSASTSDFSPEALRQTVEAALDIARFTAEDNCAGLPDANWLAQPGSIPDLALHHPWDLSIEAAIALAQRCEEAAFAVGKQITNSEGASVATQQGHFVLANSLGFMGGYPSSRHSLSCSVIAGKGDAMQRDDWYSTARDASLLASPESIGDTAARRALARVGARRIPTGKMPVLFEAPLAASLLNSFVHAASGGSLYRRASFLMGRLDKRVFSKKVNIAERPHLAGALASSPFDGEGVATRDRDLVVDGILHGWFLSTYTARKLGLASTGNAGGSHNLIVKPGKRDFKAMLRKMDRGLLVTELLGQGINYVTGDYSRGAAGFWVENGEIVHPVEEITIAGNLAEMFRSIAAIGNDVVVRGSKQVGSLLIEEMKVAGD